MKLYNITAYLGYLKLDFIFKGPPLTKNLIRYALFSASALILPGCISHKEYPNVLVEETKLGTDQSTSQIQPVSAVPSLSHISSSQSSLIGYQDKTLLLSSRIRHYDWDGAIQPMVDDILRVKGIIIGSLLMVDNINNRTNGYLNVRDATEILRKALANNDRFALVSGQQLSMAKHHLGLSSQDKLNSRGKAIGIARNVGAQYLLYSNASGNVSSPSLQMQLMLVQTGEIIWLGKGVVLPL